MIVSRFNEGTGPVAIGNVMCSSRSATKLTSCVYTSHPDCSHYYDLALKCRHTGKEALLFCLFYFHSLLLHIYIFFQVIESGWCPGVADQTISLRVAWRCSKTMNGAPFAIMILILMQQLWPAGSWDSQTMLDMVTRLGIGKPI